MDVRQHAVPVGRLMPAGRAFPQAEQQAAPRLPSFIIEHADTMIGMPTVKIVKTTAKNICRRRNVRVRVFMSLIYEMTG